MNLEYFSITNFNYMNTFFVVNLKGELIADNLTLQEAQALILQLKQNNPKENYFFYNLDYE